MRRAGLLIALAFACSKQEAFDFPDPESAESALLVVTSPSLPATIAAVDLSGGERPTFTTFEDTAIFVLYYDAPISPIGRGRTIRFPRRSLRSRSKAGPARASSGADAMRARGRGRGGSARSLVRRVRRLRCRRRPRQLAP